MFSFRRSSEQGSFTGYKPCEVSGRALIISIKDRREEYADHEQKRAKEALKLLGYETETEMNPYAEEVKEAVRKHAMSDWTKYGSSVVVLLAHGGSSGIECRGGEFVRVEDLFKMLTEKEAPGLKDKPKIWLIGSCRGDERALSETPDRDFMWAFATTSGQPAWSEQMVDSILSVVEEKGSSASSMTWHGLLTRANGEHLSSFKKHMDQGVIRKRRRRKSCLITCNLCMNP